MTSFRNILRCEEVEALRLPRRPMYQGGVRWEGSDLKDSSGGEEGQKWEGLAAAPSWESGCIEWKGVEDMAPKLWACTCLRYMLEMGMFGRVT